MLKNAVISAEGVLPMCQDTGTAIVIGKRGSRSGQELRMRKLSRKVFSTPTPRISCATPRMRHLSLYEEKTRGANLPAQIDLYATEGETYEFFSSPKGRFRQQTFLFQETKAY